MIDNDNDFSISHDEWKLIYIVIFWKWVSLPFGIITMSTVNLNFPRCISQFFLNFSCLWNTWSERTVDPHFYLFMLRRQRLTVLVYKVSSKEWSILQSPRNEYSFIHNFIYVRESWLPFLKAMENISMTMQLFRFLLKYSRYFTLPIFINCITSKVTMIFLF